MHETTLIRNVLEAILHGSDPRVPVSEIHIRVGELELHGEKAFRDGFHMAAQGTRLESARLSLDIVPPDLRCPACGHEAPCLPGTVDPHSRLGLAPCPACGGAAALSGGRGIAEIRLRVEDPGGP